MRLFAAVHLSDEEYFLSLQKRIVSPKTRLSLTKTFHLTLKFLGEVRDARPILERLEKVKFDSTKIIVDHIGVFPSSGDSSVVWAGIKANPVIMKLQKDIDSALDGLYEPEKDWAAHITLARVKLAEEGYAQRVKEIKVHPKTFAVLGFSLVESRLTPVGSVYEDVCVFPSISVTD